MVGAGETLPQELKSTLYSGLNIVYCQDFKKEERLSAFSYTGIRRI